MNCSQASELMLEVDVVDLEGRNDSELSAHIHECPKCASNALRILKEQQELKRLLRTERPKTSIDIGLARSGRRAVSARRRRRIWQAGIPVAAAAGLTGILLANVGRNGPLDSAWQAPESNASLGLDIETPAGKNVAVFEVEDRPDIVVVWFYDQGD